MTLANNSTLRTLGSGLAGALVTTAINETARRTIPAAPRLDTLGRRAIVGAMRQMDLKPPKGKQLQSWALAGDLLFNSLYFGLAGANRGSWLRGSLLGLGAGLGAVALPPTMKLGRWPTRRTPATKLMTVGWYLAGGLAAAATAKLFCSKTKSKRR
jgi:hypothetical protein